MSTFFGPAEGIESGAYMGQKVATVRERSPAENRVRMEWKGSEAPPQTTVKACAAPSERKDRTTT